MKRTIGLVLASIMIAALAIVPVFGATDTGSGTVQVQINEITMIDVNPETLDFGSANPGDVLTTFTASGVTMNGIVIENIGSTNISSVYINNSKPSSDPFGTGDVSNYDPANWIQFSLDDGATDPYFYAARVEFKDSSKPLYLQTDAGMETGRLRMGNKEYFFAYNSTTLIIGIDPHNETQTGDIDLASGCEAEGHCAVVSLDSTDKIGNLSTSLTDVDSKAPLWNATCVKVDDVNGKVYFFKWDKSLDPNDVCQFDTYAMDGTWLLPGDRTNMYVKLAVPYGVAYSTNGAGSSPGPQISGTIMVVASSPNSN